MLKIENLSKEFKKKEVLHQVSLTMEYGVYGLLGPNGAGKTTILRCITGVYDIAPGTIFCDGEDITKSKTYASSIGYLPQKFGLFPMLTVKDMMLLMADMKKIPKNEQKEDIEFCLEAVAMQDHLDDKIKTLSGGMVRRLGIAQALLGTPKLIVLDEPTAGLDPEERIRFKNMIASLPKDRTVLLSTHIVEDVAALCDHIFILSEGAVVFAGRGSETAQVAEGMVYIVPSEKEGELTGEYFVAGRQETALRVISRIRQPGEQVSPTIEDGYLCKVRRIEK